MLLLMMLLWVFCRFVFIIWHKNSSEDSELVRIQTEWKGEIEHIQKKPNGNFQQKMKNYTDRGDQRD